jgi:murein L,D-transpeptidase YcbB/YkuD
MLVLYGCSWWSGPTRSEIHALKAQLEQQDPGDIVRQIYAGREFRPVWIARGQKLERVQQFFQLVDDGSHGVHTDTSNLKKEYSDLIQFDLDVTSALVRYASNLARKDAVVKEEIENAIATDQIGQLGDRLAPKHDEYLRLKKALQTARQEVIHAIEINMARWRSLPDNLGERHIRVNIPRFELEVHVGAQVPIKMKVVVGSNDDKTPIFSSEMKYVVFSPYWNIPKSIMIEETVPKILEDPDYLKKENLEVVRISGKKVEVIDPRKVDWNKASETDIQLRQKPGDANSLGLVKFMFPNRFNVYLHDTPADTLFDRLTRNFSHGCVRLEQPLTLAEYVLRDQPDWTRERIEEAMHGGEETHVALKEPLPVYLLYFTAWVDDNGTTHIEKDVYGYDRPDGLSGTE